MFLFLSSNVAIYGLCAFVLSPQGHVSTKESIGKKQNRCWVTLFKIVIAAACTSGFLYQAVGVVLYFRSYPALVSSVFVHDAAEFPAVTICLSSWLVP
ncbi:hypothetical protein HPB48_022552 [Haemaphysalis longicornis]|uniref:Uncharacterized protein n=1 Tax=Haemaphysalis longicornis TaxID=44386 RepID=A0A9J6FZJ2_HAELO|nr:hypothetical protein HPB48_022552 [Haemaphysalis longicornis]